MYASCRVDAYMLFSGTVMVMVRIGIKFNVWLVCGYAHVFLLHSVVVFTLPMSYRIRILGCK